MCAEYLEEGAVKTQLQIVLIRLFNLQRWMDTIFMTFFLLEISSQRSRH